MSKFWGLTVNVGKKFKQQVQESFCISGAALEPLDLPSGKYDDKPVLLYLQQDQNDFLLCSLSPKQSVLQVSLNVRIGNGETVGFHLKGGSPKTKVHLTGYTLPRDNLNSTLSPASSVPFKGQQRSILVTEPKSADKQKKRVSIVETEAYGEQEELESDIETEIMEDGDNAVKKLFNGSLGQDSDDDDDEDDDDDDDSDSDINDEEMQELKEMLLKGKYNPKTGGKLAEGEDSDSDDLEMLDEEEDDDEDDDEDEDDDDSDDGEDNTQIQKKKQEPKSPNSQSPEKQKQGSAQNTPIKEKKGDPNNSNKADAKTPENKHLKQVKTPSSAGHTPMKSFSKGGVLVNDVKVGNGQAAKMGKMITVYYEGRLKSNNKRFDATQNGPGFKFRLGKGEVIKGWDLGIEGMKVGGKRRLVIPAQLAYGKRGAPPDIPPNSTLVFESPAGNHFMEVIMTNLGLGI